MSDTIVVDYGIGNVFSVCNALRAIGCEAKLTGDLTAIRKADRVILPGVGAFARAMDALHAKGISDALRDFVDTGRPFLGICIGMQVLMDRSSEFGDTKGLGFVPGTVERIAAVSPSGQHLRVPHIGWAPLVPSHGSGEGWNGTALEGADDVGYAVYFVHSYHCRPDAPERLIAHVDYDGLQITAAIRCDNITGVQFHPERSGRAGQKILEQFLAT
ncbi:imidazole glycerol phosphate synthase subunit HisH [Rhodopseudomonas palustris]|uniref:Imidazole glycerol phosphate synthase subunit HisH n=1 Tax=Rhodopseudomonas palustris TaxID=1076 RepID=A0AAX3E0B1_RHOPL|nr:imidazole glycerol phosphate synthase subunit HisH [Rhodopseudomonas palustris]UYO40496.1 imidazole glycerol phosphate synthase subunit HisH [Rhodopseudomonas palustris]